VLLLISKEGVLVSLCEGQNAKYPSPSWVAPPSSSAMVFGVSNFVGTSFFSLIIAAPFYYHQKLSWP